MEKPDLPRSIRVSGADLSLAIPWPVNCSGGSFLIGLGSCYPIETCHCDARHCDASHSMRATLCEPLYAS